MNIRFRLIISILCFLMPALSLWADSASLTVQKEMNRVAVNPALYIYIDKTRKMDINLIQRSEIQNKFKLSKTNAFGYTDDIYWARLHVKNAGPEPRKWFIELDYAVFDNFQIFKRGSETPLGAAGDKYEFNRKNRKIPFRNVVFPLTEAPNSEQVYYLRLETTSSMKVPLYAYTDYEFQDKLSKEQLILGLYYGTMLVMFVYNLFIFISTRKLSYLLYILHILVFNLFQATLNGLTFQYLWPDSIRWANNSLPFFISLGSVVPLLFSMTFLDSRKNTPKTALVYYPVIAVAAVSAVLSFFVSYSIAIRLATFTLAALVPLMLVNGVQCLLNGQRSAWYFLVAWTMFLVGIAMQAMLSYGILPENFFTAWAMQLGSAMEVVLLALGLADRINELSRNLSDKVVELGTARAKIAESEKRYRNLFEGDDDFMFTLDENWNFESANRSVSGHLGYKPADLLGKNFLDIVYNGQDKSNADFNRRFVSEKLEELKKTGESIHLQAEFSQKRIPEPREIKVALQYIEYDERRELLGKASGLQEEALFRFLSSEKLNFSMNNYLQNVEPLSQRLTKNMSRFTDATTILEMKYSLREIIINGIEHGNLNINFEEKTQTQLEGTYFDFIRERQADPRYADRKVTVEYRLSPKSAAFRITDEGDGFDHNKMDQLSMDELAAENIAHGRGIKMTRSIFDVVEYNEKGNQVTLVKHFSGEGDDV